MKNYEHIHISPRSQKLVGLILAENPFLKSTVEDILDFDEFLKCIESHVVNEISKSSIAYDYYTKKYEDLDIYENLAWKDLAAIRILDYIYHEGTSYHDPNLNGKAVVSSPFTHLWLAIRDNAGGANEDFFEDMLELFRQFNGTSEQKIPNKEKVTEWMDRHPSGLDEDIIEIRKENKYRILKVILSRIEEGTIKNVKYQLPPNISEEEKLLLADEWWEDRWFHLKFAVRDVQTLNEMLDYSLDDETLEILEEAESLGIPFFINPYYLSLLNVRDSEVAVGSDLAIRNYIIYTKELVEKYGSIVAWEMEDSTEAGKPNAAGWILPDSHSVHRRYPEVAIMIPDTVGRACGGLCSSCQRMYDFQSGNLNFNLDRLAPKESWQHKLERLMNYFENDAQLRDILITGGDALMSQDTSLKRMLDAVYDMAVRKIKANQSRDVKYAEILRVRLGTRMPAYLPQRITLAVTKVLSDFKAKAMQIGIKQFVIQTHFESAMEITPEARQAVRRLISAGWTVTNQLVFTTAASRRGHTNKLRKVLNDIGVLTYYTFTVKGFKENKYNFATNERAVQEQMEEKILGNIPRSKYELIRQFPINAEDMSDKINKLRKEDNLPFLATDRNVINLPGVGKSLTFRVIGITRDGRRILEFDHDSTRNHSPIIHEIGKVIIIESKSIREYLDQLTEMGENPEDYSTIWGYSIAKTEPRIPIYEYPSYDFEICEDLTNFELEDTYQRQEMINA